MCPLIIYWIIIVPIYLAEEDLLDGRPVAHKWFASLFTSALLLIIHEAPTQQLSRQDTNLNSEEGERSWKSFLTPLKKPLAYLSVWIHFKIDLSSLRADGLMRFSGKRERLYRLWHQGFLGHHLGSNAVLESITSLWSLSAILYRFPDVVQTEEQNV